MGIYEITGYDRGLHLHERPQTRVTLTPGQVAYEAVFAPGDIEMAGQESWTGEVFKPLGDSMQADLKRLDDDREAGEYQYEVHGSERIPQGTKAVVRTIVFGGDSSGEFGYWHEEREILVTDPSVDPAIGQQIELHPKA